MKAEWKDTTSYCQGERGRVEPRSWTLSGDLVEITVHHYLGCGETWFVSCRQAGIDTLKLSCVSVSAAKREAIHRVREKLKCLSDDAAALAS